MSIGGLVAWVEEVAWIEEPLDLAERLDDPGAVHPGDQVATDPPITVFARDRTTVPEHEIEGLLPEPHERVPLPPAPEIDPGPDVEQSDRGVGVEDPLPAVTPDQRIELPLEGRQLVDRHPAVLESGHRLAVPIRLGDETQAGRADRPHPRLGRRVVDDDGRIGIDPGPGHRLGRIPPGGLPIPRVEFDEEHGTRPTPPETRQPRDVAGEHRLVRRGVDDERVHQLHRRRPGVDQRLHVGTGLRDALEGGDQERLRGRPLDQPHRRRGGDRERALGPDQEASEIDRTVAVLESVKDVVEPVAPDVPGDPRESGPDLVRQRTHDRLEPPRELPVGSAVRRIHRSELEATTVRQDRIDRSDVFVGHPVDDRRGPGRGVAHHAPQGRMGRGRDVGAEGQAVSTGGPSQVVEHHAGFDPGGAGLRIEMQDAVQVRRAVDDDRLPHRLPGEAGPRASWKHGNVVVPTPRDESLEVLRVPGRGDRERRDLVGRGVRREETAIEGGRPDLASHDPREIAHERREANVELRQGHVRRSVAGHARMLSHPSPWDDLHPPPRTQRRPAGSGASRATNRTRTGDLSFTKASLYQLSYGGVVPRRGPEAISISPP